MRNIDQTSLPNLPRDDEGPVFQAPWEAQAFAMAVALQARGLFTWREWSAAMAAELSRSAVQGDPDDGTQYYEHWLTALERIAADKQIVSRAELERHREKWDEAVRATPHGLPVAPPSVD